MSNRGGIKRFVLLLLPLVGTVLSINIPVPDGSNVPRGGAPVILRFKIIPFQTLFYSCGPAVLAAVLEYLGKIRILFKTKYLLKKKHN